MGSVDAAVIRLLKLNPATSTVALIRNGGPYITTWIVTTTLPDGARKRYILKTGPALANGLKFAGEHASLNAIHKVVPSLCVESFGHGKLEDMHNTWFICTQYMEISPHAQRSASRPSLAAKIAQLHSRPAPIPAGHTFPTYGFPVMTYCGATEQQNQYRNSWEEFFTYTRMIHIIDRAEKAHGVDDELHAMVWGTITMVIPRLIGDNHLNGGWPVPPVVCHGSLWYAHTTKGRFDEDSTTMEDVAYDPAAVYGHSEYDLGAMKMSSGASFDFFEEHNRLYPKLEPVEEFEDRIKLYELYFHLNNYTLYGVGFRDGAIEIMRYLLNKYASPPPIYQVIFPPGTYDARLLG